MTEDHLHVELKKMRNENKALRSVVSELRNDLAELRSTISQLQETISAPPSTSANAEFPNELTQGQSEILNAFYEWLRNRHHDLGEPQRLTISGKVAGELLKEGSIPSIFGRLSADQAASLAASGSLVQLDADSINDITSFSTAGVKSMLTFDTSNIAGFVVVPYEALSE